VGAIHGLRAGLCRHKVRRLPKLSANSTAAGKCCIVVCVQYAILYIDYDGVVHADAVYRRPGSGIVMGAPGRSLFEWAPYLEQALEPYPFVRLVLSTSWVRILGYSRARAYLPHALQARVIGATFHRREHGPTRELRDLWAQTSTRGAQIAADLRRRGTVSWLAVDDAVDEFSEEQRSRLVACNGQVGLSDPGTRAMLDSMLERVAKEFG
jgi:hypothetical protein